MAKDYKDTLNLPATAFPMKASLSEMEPGMLSFWESEKIYEAILEKNKGRKRYVLHDGPPYANGHIHMGHALNKILKDIIVKFKSMQGYYSPYVPGWDCHGLPIELEVDKKIKKDAVDIVRKRVLCREYAAGFVDIQRDEFGRLGVFGQWGRPYLTMSYDYEASIVRELFDFVEKGSVYRGKKPVHWCPSCVTALAEAEVEYAEKESPSIFVMFKLNADEASNRLKLVGNNAYIVIWTTTPWTLPANLALAVKDDIDYAAVISADQKDFFIVAKDLVNKLHSQGILKTKNVYRIFPGHDLRGLKADHPFINRKSVVIEADFVSTEEGTGVVHIAPGHGEDDYNAGIKEGLDIYAPVDDRGKFAGTGVEDIEGQFVFKVNETVIEKLKSKGALLFEEKTFHSYPHCWRCKKPVIFRATEQWFISMQKHGLREKCLDEIESVKWIPAWGKDRIYGMVKGRPDWCISRQRAWGVPIALFVCLKCGRILDDKTVFNKVIGLFEENGADIWFKMSTEEILGDIKCHGCGGNSFRKEKDILDVWFDSGVSYAAVLLGGSYFDLAEGRAPWPSDLYLEGSDQHRGWFQSSLLASVGIKGKAPYRTVLTHGFVVDGKGKKMSKSIGNVVAPQEIIKATGAEILRLWVSAEDYKDDIRISNEIISRLTEAYRKIRNTARFLLGNTDDFDGADMSGSLTEIDRWAMSRLQGLIGKVTDAYERFDFHEVYHAIHNFCVVDMSSFYLDILKDRLYTFKKDSEERRASQWVLREVLMKMTGLMAPVLSFTAEEIWRHLKVKPTSSVFLSEFPVVNDGFIDKELERKWERLIAIRDEANKALEIKRAEKFIGNSLEAKVIICLNEEDYGLLSGYTAILPALFIVSQAETLKSCEGEYRSESVQGLSVTVLRAEGEKCQRCWNRQVTVGKHADEPEVCERCYGILKS